ncbi:MAG: LamG-like jellyroll fold domain-containing protein, partial [Pseudonocardiaceae bacterium]
MDISRSTMARLTHTRRARWFGLFLLVLGGALSSFVAHAQTGPVGYWKLDEGTGSAPQDSSGNANHCTMSPPPAWTSGRVNGALSFDGVDDTVSCGTGASVTNLAAISVSAWINLASVGEGGFGRLLQKGDGGNPSAGWRLVTQGTRRLEFSADFASADVGRLSNDSAFSFNTWAHVVATWDGSTNGTGVHLYVNGTELTYATTWGASGARNSDSAMPLRIGNRDSSAATTNGKVDEVRIYNRVLSLSEIQALADATAPSAPTSPAATAVSSSQIDVTWTASTDNVAVTGYRVERCQGASCTSWAEVATPAASPFNDTGRSASAPGPAGTAAQVRALSHQAEVITEQWK